MLDKLFSREIQRRTGAHAINIYIEDKTKQRKRSRAIGSTAIKNTTKVTTKPKGSLFHRLDVRFPWLKFITVIVIGVIIILDLLDLTISKIGDPTNKIRVAPMSQHLRATERVFKDKKLVALTFDDGPSPATTPRLLDILHEKDVLATFFTLGNAARSNPDIVKRAAKEHHEIGSHTMYHQNLIRISAAAATDDINEAKATIKSILGHDPKYTRPPYGNVNDAVRTATGTPLILWSVDTEDWKNKDSSTMLTLTTSEVSDGAIILMHDIYPTTVEAVANIIDTLRQNGYEFVTISELTKLRNTHLENGTVYYKLGP